MKKVVLLSVIAVLLSGCATSFTGSAKITNGPAGCESKCTQWGMDFVGMVILGEYTDGCICRKKGEKLSMQDVGQSMMLSSAGAGAGAAGVMMQTEADKK